MVVPWVAVSRLTDFHDTAPFRCGVDSLDHWLAESALGLQAEGKTAVHVAESESGQVVGYFALAPHEPWAVNLPRRVKGNSRDGRMQAILLGKLALDQSFRGMGFGPFLVLEALRVACAAADLVGGRAIVVDAQHERVAKFYEEISFLRAGVFTPLKLYMRVSTARDLLGEFDRGDAD